jgi:hypothetical protein
MLVCMLLVVARNGLATVAARIRGTEGAVDGEDE